MKGKCNLNVRFCFCKP